VTIRVRLVLAFALVAIVPLALVGLGLRRELTRRTMLDFESRLTTETESVALAVNHESMRIAGQLRSLVAAFDEDSRLRRALMRPGDDNVRYLLDYARRSMALTGLSMLRLQDDSDRILSSGHFRGEAGRSAPGVVDSLLAYQDGVTLLETRTPGADALRVVARVDSLVVASTTFWIIGGVALEPDLIERLPSRNIRLVLAQSDSPGLDPSTAGQASFGVMVIAEDEVATVSAARFVVTRDTAALHAMQRSIDSLLAGGLGAMALLLLGVAWLLATRISQPVVELAEKTSRVDLTNLDVDFASERVDEVGQLADLLSDMIDRLKRSREKLAAAERRATIGDLSRQVNHDIKNGLTPIRNVLDHLREVAEQDPSAVAAVFKERQRTLDASIAYLDDLARNIAGLTPGMTRKPCNVNAAIRDVASTARNGVRMEVELDPNDPIVLADHVAVRRVFQNLIGNAVDSATPKGVVTVSSKVVDESYRVTVRDDGSGMTPEELDHAFSEWYSTKETGTGLGLPIVRRLVLDLGGNLRVETAPGRGTSMTVELPLPPSHGAESA